VDEAHRRLLELIEKNWDAELRFLQGMVRRPSTLGNEARVQQFIARELREMGLDVDVWEIDHAEIARLPGYGPVEWSYEGRPNVAATWRSSSEGGRSLILNGHIDVVPATPEHHWTYDPWGAEVVDGRMYGRGACDMKGGVAAMIYAVRALKEAGITLNGDVTLETVIEEECSGNGALATLARGYKADAVIIPEAWGQTALEAHVGVLWARIVVRGRGAHAQSADQAVNPILKAYPLIRAVQELEAEVNAPEDRSAQFEGIPRPLNYNVGIIRGGDWASSVPQECAFEVRIATYPGDDLDEVQGRFKSRLLEAAKADLWLSDNPPEIGFYSFRAEGSTVGRDEPIVRSLQKAHRSIMGEDLKFHTALGTADVRFFNLYHGIPATCYGTAGGNLHAPDEWVELKSLRDATEVLALTIADWCGVTEPL